MTSQEWQMVREVLGDLKGLQEVTVDVQVLGRALVTAQHEGYVAGKAQGYRAGRKEGFEEGVREGKHRGISKGWKIGYRAGDAHALRRLQEMIAKEVGDGSVD